MERVEISRRYWEKRGKELVDIDFSRIREIAEEIASDREKREKLLHLPDWRWKEYYPADPVEYISHVGIAVAADACFWLEKGHWYFMGEKGASGWHKLTDVLRKRGDRKGKGKNSRERVASYLANLTLEEFEEILKIGGSNATELQLKRERVRNLNEYGRVLLEEYEGDFTNFLEAAGWEGPEIVEQLALKFPVAYGEDRVKTQEGVIPFDKRNHLVCIMLFEGLPSRGYGKNVKGLENMIPAIDYRIPQALRGMGALKYHDELARKIEKKEVLERNGREELAIRTAALVASYTFMKELQKFEETRDVNAAHIDAYLFLRGRKMGDNFHRVRTLAY